MRNKEERVPSLGQLVFLEACHQVVQIQQNFLTHNIYRTVFIVNNNR